MRVIVDWNVFSVVNASLTAEARLLLIALASLPRDERGCLALPWRTNDSDHAAAALCFPGATWNWETAISELQASGRVDPHGMKLTNAGMVGLEVEQPPEPLRAVLRDPIGLEVEQPPSRVRAVPAGRPAYTQTDTVTVDGNSNVVTATEAAIAEAVAAVDESPAPSPAPPATRDLTPQEQEVMDAWNECAANSGGAIVPIQRLTQSRRVGLRRRLRDAEWPWREAIANLPVANREDFTWQPDFSWLIRNDTNADRLASGFYNRTASDGVAAEASEAVIDFTETVDSEPF